MSIRCFDKTEIIRILARQLSTVAGMADVSFSSIVSLSDPPRQVNLTRTMVGQRAFVFAATTGQTCETPGVHASESLKLCENHKEVQNLGEGTSVVMAFVGRKFVVLAFAQVYKKKIVVGYQSPCPIKLLVSLLGQKIGVFAVAEILKREKGLEADSVEHHDVKKVEFLRISLTEFHSCTSRSHYQSVSKQTTRVASEVCAVASLKSIEGHPSYDESSDVILVHGELPGSDALTRSSTPSALDNVRLP
ncbi:hypothetical protein Tco_0569983 [Tanacetum coccineum]